MSQSTVITTGFGSFGSVNLIPTLGFSSEIGGEVHGVIVRRGKTLLWPEWVEEQKEFDRVDEEIKALETERDQLLSELRSHRAHARLQENRIRLARQIAKEQKAFAALLAKLRRERKDALDALARRKAMREEFIRIREEQEEEDLRVISFIIGDLYG